MDTQQSVIEPLYSFQEISALWKVSIEQVRKLFVKRRGVINVGAGTLRPAWRVPASLALDVMVERGYTREAATRALAQASPMARD
jgi:hypothetical protein